MAGSSEVVGVELTVNGKSEQLDDGATVSDLIAKYKLQAVRVAVELNGDIVPRATYADTPLSDGDTLEVVTLVGGG